ncbi:hypothetical protein [Bradyrhizobium sp. LHD-71]|uniref:hypothetical protein n=1 Tax=Bradyrhizobium sp. LHD-71 TaxID=3072141 RepID=UPI00280C7A81|nr:hypothetical protein [Bradyrhizobium sp. LHD-71]MDQ8726428.1 hypothetical protein [Bradyrhizobium sp. LHD-71]
MRTIAACLLSIVVSLLVIHGSVIPAALAQDLRSPPPKILPPPPPPPPPPRIEVPRVPQLNEIPPSPRAAVPRPTSYSDRVRGCIHQGAAMGLRPNARAAYTRACANR